MHPDGLVALRVTLAGIPLSKRRRRNLDMDTISHHRTHQHLTLGATSRYVTIDIACFDPS